MRFYCAIILGCCLDFGAGGGVCIGRRAQGPAVGDFVVKGPLLPPDLVPLRSRRHPFTKRPRESKVAVALSPGDPGTEGCRRRHPLRFSLHHISAGCPPLPPVVDLSSKREPPRRKPTKHTNIDLHFVEVHRYGARQVSRMDGEDARPDCGGTGRVPRRPRGGARGDGGRGGHALHHARSGRSGTASRCGSCRASDRRGCGTC